MKDSISQLISEIEAIVIEELSKQTQAVVSIILDWNHDYTEIHFWFESQWNDHSDPYGTPTFVFPCTTFATLIDAIIRGETSKIDYTFNEETDHFKNFGNLLTTNDPIKSTLLVEAFNAAKATLICITKQLGIRQNLPQQEQLLSFKVSNIENVNHPTLTALYSPYTQNKLFKVAINHIQSNVKINGYITLTDKEILFFRTNEAEKPKWQTIFNNESNSIALHGIDFIDFGLENQFGRYKLLCTTKNSGKVALSFQYEIDQTIDNRAIISLFINNIRQNSTAIENETINKLKGHEKKILNIKEEDIHPNDKLIVQMVQKEPLASKPLSFLPYLEKNLNLETPFYWNVTEMDTHNDIGTSLLFFKQNNKIFNFTTEGLLVEFCIEENQLILKSKKEIVAAANCAYYYEHSLYIAHNETEIISYNLQQETVTNLAIDSTNIDTEIDHIFVNEHYMTLCTTEGLALYRKKAADFEFVELLTVGSTQILYTWAKEALIYNNYLYITAGNTGLVTYKLIPDEKPKLLHVLSPDCEHPFCDKIDLVGTNLVVKMEGNHWILDIYTPEKPKTKTLLVGEQKKEKMGPILLDNHLLFIDESQPLIWNYSIKTNNQVEVFCEHIAKNGEDVYFYYPKNYFLEENTLLFSGNYGYAVLKRETTLKMDYTLFKQIEAKEDTLYYLMEQELDTYFGGNKENLVGKLEIEPTKSGFKLSIYAPEYLVKSIGYSQNQLLSKDFSWSDLALKVEDLGYPYYAIQDKEFKKTNYNLIKKLLLRFFQSSKEYWHTTVYFTYKGYNERVDRNSIIVEFVK